MPAIDDSGCNGLRAALLAAAPMVSMGALISVLPFASFAHGQAAWIGELSPWSGAPAVAVTLFVVLIWHKVRRDLWPTTATVLFICTLYPGPVAEIARSYQVNDVGAMLREQRRTGGAVAYLGNYHGEFGFAGRLRAPVTELDNDSLPDWIVKNPNGVVIERTRDEPDANDVGIEYARLYRSGFLVLRRAAPGH
jgi:hypothetical protein